MAYSLNSDVSIDGNSKFSVFTGTSGSILVKGQVATIKSDGLIYPCATTDEFIGFNMTTCAASGLPATIVLQGARITAFGSSASPLTMGERLVVSATAGLVEGVSGSSNSAPVVAKVLSATDILVK